MNTRLIVRSKAEEDLTEARDWYDDQCAGLGQEFLIAVDEAFERIRQFPEIYAAEYRNVRRARLRRFPYVVYYRIVDEGLEVLAVLHGSRHPRTWRSRA